MYQLTWELTQTHVTHSTVAASLLTGTAKYYHGGPPGTPPELTVARLLVLPALADATCLPTEHSKYQTKDI